MADGSWCGLWLASRQGGGRAAGLRRSARRYGVRAATTRRSEPCQIEWRWWRGLRQWAAVRFRLGGAEHLLLA